MEITDNADGEKSAILRRRHSMSAMMAAEAAEEARSRSDAEELRKALEEREDRIEFLEREAKAMNQSNAKREMKVRELERRLMISEMKETEERSKRIRAEEATREKIGEIGSLVGRMEELEKALRECEEREWVVIGLRERVKEAERVIRMMAGNGGSEEKGMELQWAVGVAGAVTAVVAAVIYLWFGKHKSSHVIRR